MVAALKKNQVQVKEIPAIVRLVAKDGTVGGSAGRLEVFREGEWGTVCDDAAPGAAVSGGDQGDNKMANVVCKMLGFASGRVHIHAEYGEGDGPIWMDKVNCSGDESNIFDCPHNNSNVCTHNEDIGVSCYAQ